MAGERGWRAVAFATAAVATASVAWLAVNNTEIDPTCAYVDGEGYCAMVAGQLADQPFSRRVLVPWLVEAMPDIPPGTAFRTFAVLGLLAAAVLSGVLVRRSLLLVGADEEASTWLPVVAGALVVLSPYGVHLALWSPVMVDHAGLALGLGWLVALTGRRPWWSVALVVLAVLAREQWVPVILVVGLLHLRRAPGLAIAMGVAAVGTLGFVLTRPSSPSDYDTLEVIEHYARERFNSIGATIYGYGVGLGFVLAVVLLARRLPWPAMVTLAAAVVTVAISPASGFDYARIASPALALGLPAALVVVWMRRAVWPLVGALVASAVLWRPFRRLAGGPEETGDFYYATGDGSTLGTAVALVVLAVVLAAYLTGGRSAVGGLVEATGGEPEGQEGAASDDLAPRRGGR